MKLSRNLAYASAEEMRSGFALHPVRCRSGLSIGDGAVYPEVNFTLPPMKVERSGIAAVLQQYHAMVESVLSRLVKLGVRGAVLEFEHAPQMTADVEIGQRIAEQTLNQMQHWQSRDGLLTALRVTICDIRETDRPPLPTTGAGRRTVMEAFACAAEQGADMLSIESTGGKEICDPALMAADVEGILFALGVLAPRDVRSIWRDIVSIARTHRVVPAGDTACAFANTAMVLADQGYIPNVLAAVVRAMGVVRTLAAHEEGAVGPTKDCAYEGPMIKAICGCPISMEGKAAACAHFSHMGNIALAVADLWSNESVQNVRLLSGDAPEVFTEILTYDCRLVNTAIEHEKDADLRRLLVASDCYESVHALVISPDAAFEIARAIVGGNTDFERTRQAGLTACELMRDAADTGALTLPERELSWLARIEDALSETDGEDLTIARAAKAWEGRFLPSEYGL